MKITVLTIFPEMFTPFWDHGIIRRAIASGVLESRALDIRDFTRDKHKTADDRPFGGGAGMVLKPEPIAAAIHAVRSADSRVVLMSPQGRPFDQATAQAMARMPEIIFICGRYEGVDERIFYRYVDHELSIGDYILTGGEIAAMAVIDAVTRLLPGALGCADSAAADTFSDANIEHAHYTRPRMFEGDDVPEVLLSGHHHAIEQWRQETGLLRTVLKRPDLLKHRRLSPSEIQILQTWCGAIEDIVASQTVSGPGALPGCKQEK